MTTTSRTSRALFALAAVPLLVVALAACTSGDGDATPDVKSDSQVSSDAQKWDVANASCLRSEGIDMPDPSADGMKQGIPMTGDMDAMTASIDKCEKKVTDELGPRPVTAQEKKLQKEFEEQARESAKCLREKGYDVADPSEGGSGLGNGAEDVPDDVLEACGGAAGNGSVTVQK
ncbi:MULTISPECIES: hypothetical protein [unclassified Frigoribacterium]|uniref:hypothetical protein n=1 Tax=unclassified Frigoribacterium TaxID=2627005 RepID=UPI000F47C575|nr:MULTISPECIES: hypothetical protein [unclassified Frigoribacterium]ROP75240.1 hypothetical protein EDF18_1859 [Frigoribacterium sp. PhB107]TDT62270.1 hypothetical protein EDF20_2936 [Frigoribacterium sp. PhB116]